MKSIMIIPMMTSSMQLFDIIMIHLLVHDLSHMQIKSLHIIVLSIHLKWISMISSSNDGVHVFVLDVTHIIVYYIEINMHIYHCLENFLFRQLFKHLRVVQHVINIHMNHENVHYHLRVQVTTKKKKIFKIKDVNELLMIEIFFVYSIFFSMVIFVSWAKSYSRRTHVEIFTITIKLIGNISYLEYPIVHQVNFSFGKIIAVKCSMVRHEPFSFTWKNIQQIIAKLFISHVHTMVRVYQQMNIVRVWATERSVRNFVIVQLIVRIDFLDVVVEVRVWSVDVCVTIKIENVIRIYVKNVERLVC